MRIYLRVNKGKVSEANRKKGKSQKNSLFLDYHPGSGKKRRFEFLKLYVYDKPKNNLEKEHNKETMNLAESIRAKRILDAQSTAHGFVSSVRGNVGFLAFFKQLTANTVTGTGIGLSTLTKVLYFFRFTVEGIPCLIFDRRIIEVCNTQIFSELSALAKISDLNKCNKYYDYLVAMRELANANSYKPDQLELFLFQFGNNLKPVNVSGSLV